MESIIIVFASVFLFLFKGSCVWHCAADYRSLEAETVFSFLCPWYPGWRKSPQETIPCLNREVGTEGGKQVTTEKQPLSRPGGSDEH